MEVVNWVLHADGELVHVPESDDEDAGVEPPQQSHMHLVPRAAVAEHRLRAQPAALEPRLALLEAGK
jgi:hypothetical protein